MSHQLPNAAVVGDAEGFHRKLEGKLRMSL